MKNINGLGKKHSPYCSCVAHTNCRIIDNLFNATHTVENRRKVDFIKISPFLRSIYNTSFFGLTEHGRLVSLP